MSKNVALARALDPDTALEVAQWRVSSLEAASVAMGSHQAPEVEVSFAKACAVRDSSGEFVRLRATVAQLEANLSKGQLDVANVDVSPAEQQFEGGGGTVANEGDSIASSQRGDLLFFQTSGNRLRSSARSRIQVGGRFRSNV